MADTPPLTVIINSSGGTASKLGDKLKVQVQDAFTAAGVAIDLRLVEGSDIAAEVEQAPGKVVAVGGGDGTISCAAGILSKQGRTLAVLPLGTLNHFAQAIGLDGTLEQAAHVACCGEERRIDLGIAGDRAFINNASLGMYPRMVRERDRLPLPKWIATIPAAVRILWRPGARRLHLTIDGVVRRLHTPLLFIGNNRYSLKAGQVGERESLQDGVLSLYAVQARSALSLILEALRILRGKANDRQDFATLPDARELVVQRRGRHPVALDGEVTQMAFPLTFAIRAQALTVMWPSAARTPVPEPSPDPR